MNIGILGLGTVGSGVVETLADLGESLGDICGQELVIRKILVQDLDKDRGLDIDRELLTRDFDSILEDETIDVILELTGDLEAAYGYIKSSLRRKKHVVTANKAVVSKYFEELSGLAEEEGVAFLYEASVGGGIPAIKTLREQAQLNRILRIQAILNGTCNYILSRMVQEGLDYNKVLKIAQDLGYAEFDPSADVDGLDSLRKLRILGSLAGGGRIAEEDIFLRGIGNIASRDIEYIKEMGRTVKLIGELEMGEAGFTAVVMPMLVRETDQLAHVDLAYNSINFEGDRLGQIKLFGQGAGKYPTANAVLSDLLDIALSSYRKGNPLGGARLENLNSQLRASYFLRLDRLDGPGFKALEPVLDRILLRDQGLLATTGELELFSLLGLLRDLGLEGDQYFLAKILD